MRQREQDNDPQSDLSAWEPTPQEVDAYMRECASDCPLAFLAYTWLRLKAVVYAIIDTKHDGDFGNHERYVQLQSASACFDSFDSLQCTQLLLKAGGGNRAMGASQRKREAEKTLFAHGIYAMISARGASTV